MNKEIAEFNKTHPDYGEVMTKCGGIPNTNSLPIFYGRSLVYQEYHFQCADGTFRSTYANRQDSNFIIHSPFNNRTLTNPTTGDIYIHFGCNDDPNLAMDWKNDPRFKPRYPLPMININHFTDNNQTDLKELSLLKSIVPPNSFAVDFCNNLSEVTNIPSSTVFLVTLASFSAMTGMAYNCAYEDGIDTVSISEYVLAQHPSGTNKSRLQNLTLVPMKKMIRDRIRQADKYIEILEYKAEELSLDSPKKNELIKINRKLKKMRKHLNFLSNLYPISNATPEALEEVLKHTNGVFTAISSEQALINSLLFSSGKRTNTDLLLPAREGGEIRSNRVGRVGYSGYCSGAICCFAQENVIPRVIEASDVSGLLERFLLMAEPDRIGRRNYLEPVQPNKNLLEIYEQKCAFFEKVLENGFNPDNLITLHIKPSDWFYIHHLENELEAQLIAGGQYSHPIMRRFINKIRLHIMSLACNLFLLDREAPDESCEIPSEYVHSAIYMMRQLIDGLYTYCLSKGIISNDEQIKFVFDLLVKHKDGLTMHEIKKKCEGVRPFKDLPAPRKTVQEVVHYLNYNFVLLCNDNLYVKNPNIH